MSRYLTVYPGFIPADYFTEKNINFVENLIRQNLSLDFKNEFLIDRESIVRVMTRVLEKRLESIPSMNRRVVMEMCNEIRTHQIERNKNYNLQDNFASARMLYDTNGKNVNGCDIRSIKLANRLGRPRVGGTIRFHFT